MRPTAQQTEPDSPPTVPIPSPDELAARADWREWYLTDLADMGESPEQTAIIALMVSVLRTWCEERGWSDAFVSGDHFFAWVEDEPLVRVSPDVYLLFDVPPSLPRAWHTWRPDHPTPPFVMEVVSTDWQKDYRDNPSKYAQLGVDELVIFDPGASERASERMTFQLWRRRDGELVREHAGDGPVWSRVLGAWLHEVDGAPAYRSMCRLARDEAGTDLVLAARERAAAAEARVAALEAELRKARGE